MGPRLLIFALCAFGAPAAHASGVAITVRDAAGQPLADAVVAVTSSAQPPLRLGSYEVSQQDIQFHPFVLVVPRGATVRFPNRDTVRHHVYSFSKPKRFELKLYGRQDDRTVTFDKAGTVALGCNIHDRMRGYVRVVETPFAAKTDAQGRVTIDGIPGGAATITVWHPDAAAANGEFVAALAIPLSGSVAKIITMRTRGAP